MYYALTPDWASGQSNIGLALRSLGDMTGDLKYLAEALAACRSALDVYTREDNLGYWVSEQTNLAKILKSLGQRQKDPAILEDAQAAIKEAFDALPPDDDGAETFQQIEAAIEELKA